MSKTSEPSWLMVARRFVGVAEIKGPHHHQAILDLLDIADGKDDGKNLQGIRDDETPWCASFVSGVLELDGRVSARSAWARSYASWGVQLPAPAVGAIAVLERGPTSGHVAFVVGRDAGNNIMLLGGNQSDMVKISPFSMQRVLNNGIRWPTGVASPNPASFLSLPLLASDGRPSRNEA